MSGPCASSTATITVAVDARSRDVAAVEHLAHRLRELLPAAGGPTYVATTHVVITPTPHIVVVASWSPEQTVDPDGRHALARLADDLPEACLLLDLGSEQTVAGAEELRDAVVSATRQHRTRSSGRLVHFPGSEAVGGLVSVGDLVERTCIDEVSGLAGLDLSAATLLDLGDFYRPTWCAGRCTLLVQATAGAPVPFEVRHQIACCSDH